MKGGAAEKKEEGMRIVVGNVQGLKDEDCMRDLLDQLKGRRARVAILTETHFETAKSSRRWRMSMDIGVIVSQDG